MHLPKDYLDDLLVRIAHHSAAMENNTLTLSEAVSILLYRTIPHKMSVREFYEVENHRLAFDFIIEHVDQELTISLIHDIHSLLLDRLHQEYGQFKSQENAIVGATFQTASPSETPLLMDQWVKNLNDQIRQSTAKIDMIAVICASHIEFERIHPYADGNGRIGRLLMMHLLLHNQIVPLVIQKEDKQDYFQFLENQDSKGFAAYALTTIEKEQQRYNAFLNSQPKMQG